jgi:hypothetical protein
MNTGKWSMRMLAAGRRTVAMLASPYLPCPAHWACSARARRFDPPSSAVSMQTPIP